MKNRLELILAAYAAKSRNKQVSSMSWVQCWPVCFTLNAETYKHSICSIHQSDSILRVKQETRQTTIKKHLFSKSYF